MTPSRRRSIVALAAPVLASMLAVGPLAATLAPAPAAASDITASPIQVSLATLRPVAPQPDDTLVLTGTLTNTSDETVSGLQVELKISSKVDSRSEFDDYAAEPTATLPTDELEPVADPIAAEETALTPGASEPFRISVTLDQATLDRLGLLGSWEVRELGIAVIGTTDFEVATVGQLRTFLPWAPRTATGNGVPAQVAWLWPLVDRPHRSASGTWFDDSLAPEIANGGRLNGLLAAGSQAEDQSPLGHNPKTRNVPVTWAVDPMLLSEVDAMAAGYRVDATSGTTAGTGTAQAKLWGANLRAAVTRTDAQVIALPYADPDVVAAVRDGFTTTIGVAAATGTSLLQQSLGAVTLLPYGWPLDGLADQRTVNALHGTGDTTLVLADSAIPVSGGQPAITPSAHTVLTTDDGAIQTLLTDSGLDADVDSGVDNPNGSRLSLQEFLAETLMIQTEATSVQRALVVTPDRRWDPSSSYAAALLADTGKVPWVQPVSLRAVRHSPIYTRVQREQLSYPSTARHHELSPTYLHRVSQLRTDIGEFNAIVPQGTPQIRSYTTAEQQALSSAWRDQARLANQQLTALRSTVLTEMGQVRIASKGNSYVTLTSHGGQVPVTISNNLDVPVRVTVQLVANQRLTLSRHGRVTRLVAPHQQVQVQVHAAAKTSGVFPLQVQLLTPTGHVYGRSVQLFVRSTVYGTITLVITGAATAALMIAVGIRLTRRAMAARRSSVAADT